MVARTLVPACSEAPAAKAVSPRRNAGPLPWALLPRRTKRCTTQGFGVSGRQTRPTQQHYSRQLRASHANGLSVTMGVARGLCPPRSFRETGHIATQSLLPDRPEQHWFDDQPPGVGEIVGVDRATCSARYKVRWRLEEGFRRAGREPEP
jgi:hypothetical protein